jgi:hypothetical protein
MFHIFLGWLYQDRWGLASAFFLILIKKIPAKNLVNQDNNKKKNRKRKIGSC